MPSAQQQYECISGQLYYGCVLKEDYLELGLDINKKMVSTTWSNCTYEIVEIEEQF